MINLLTVQPEILFECPTDVGHGHRCDMCGTKCLNQSRCPECGYQFDSDQEALR